MLPVITFSATPPATLPTLDYGKVRQWLIAVARDHGKKVRQLAYSFCDDREILRANREFLGHDYFTDIITFDYSSGPVVAGDMYISLETVRSNAEMLGADYSRELLRVIVHGLLHLCGIDDKAPGQRAIMEMNEDRALSLLAMPS